MNVFDRARTFTYGDLEVDASRSTLTCTYLADDVEFVEIARFDEDVDLGAPGVRGLAELYWLLAGLSYYKARAAARIDASGVALGPAGLALLTSAVRDGLGEYAWRNGLDLRDVTIEGGARTEPERAVAAQHGALVPFGGGIDSIVTVTQMSDDDAALFVVGPRTGRYEAIERPARRTGLPVARCERRLDPKILDSVARGWRNGHVPVTAMISALALVCAVGLSRSRVVMSNERSASSPNLIDGDGHAVNHQWAKSWAAEELLRGAVAERLQGAPDYYSVLRDRSELWVARQFAADGTYLGEFMSCNRAFRHDPATRATTWCGECDKCLFIDLVLAPFVDRSRLEALFDGHEPIADPARRHELEVLCGIVRNPKPFECVGDAAECATAMVAAAGRADRSEQRHLAELAARCDAAVPLSSMLQAEGPTNAPVSDAAPDLV